MQNPADAIPAPVLNDAGTLFQAAPRSEDAPCPFQAINERRAASEDPEALRRARSL